MTKIYMEINDGKFVIQTELTVDNSDTYFQHDKIYILPCGRLRSLFAASE